MLKESKTYLIKAVVKNVPRQTIFNILKQTIEIQTLGGMKKVQAQIINP